jgi:hypothetical protein
VILIIRICAYLDVFVDFVKPICGFGICLLDLLAHGIFVRYFSSKSHGAISS